MKAIIKSLRPEVVGEQYAERSAKDVIFGKEYHIAGHDYDEMYFIDEAGNRHYGLNDQSTNYIFEIIEDRKVEGVV